LVATIWAFAVFGAASAVAADGAFDALQGRLVSDGLDPDWMDKVYQNRQIALDLETAAVFFTYREAKLDYDQFSSAESIAKARRYMRQNQAALQAAEATYGVDKTVITAIILVETRLGTYLGNKPVINSLSTLAVLAEPAVRQRLWQRISGRANRAAFDDRAQSKARWAYGELKAFLRYALNHGLDPVEVTGSMAGAIGICQFMPSNIGPYGKDGNQDGRVDLFDHADAIASVGHYLKKNGWRQDQDRDGAGRVILRYNNSRPYMEAILKVSGLLKG
jgi:membrane-bound lytic murein transglycosylase B